jgi:DNA-binding FadR family transcriptional regulator
MTITQITPEEQRLAGDAKVLRDLLREALAVLDTVDSKDPTGTVLLIQLTDRISAVLNPPPVEGLL